MTLWKRAMSLDELNSMSKNTIHESLGIVFTHIGDDYLEATMPVDHRTHQPFGLLHGGASAALAESLGSVASIMAADDAAKSGVGIELSVSHLRGIKSGLVRGRVDAIRVGRALHVWDIRILNAGNGDEVCRGRLSVLLR